jgi:predicted permease
MTGPRPLPPSPGDVDPELEFHIEMQTRRFVASGMPPDAARRAAIARLGDLDGVRDACRTIELEEDVRMHPNVWFSGVWQDLCYAWRGLRRAPLFTVAAGSTLAIGIGATTAMFSVFNAVLFGALPYRHAERTVLIWNSYGASLPQASVSAAEFADFLDAPGRFEAFAAVRPSPMNLTGPCGGGGGAVCDPERVNAYIVSPNLFDLLGAMPRLGRPFVPADGDETGQDVALLSDTLWRRRYGSDTAIVGRSVMLRGRPTVVVGVMPPDVRFPDEPLGYPRERADLWIPYRWEQMRTDGRGNQFLAVLARLPQGMPIDAAQDEVDRVADRFRQAFPNRYAREGVTWRIITVPLREQMVGDVRAALAVLFGAVGLVLLIACANVANLLMTRGAVRERELAVRTALGAGRGRLVRQLVTETGLVALLGAGAGLGLAQAGVILLRRLDAGAIPRLDAAGLDARVLVFTAALTLMTTMLVGLIPALRQARMHPQRALGDGGARGAGRSGIRRGLRRLLVVGEVALAAVVLVGAGLVARSVTALQHAATGVQSEGVVTFQLSPPQTPYDTGDRLSALHERLIERLESLPGVTRVSAINPLPMSGDRWSGTFMIDGRPVPEGQPDPHAELATVQPGYFEALGIPLIDGRDFTPADRRGAPAVVVIDEELARRHWPGERAVGRRLDTDGLLPEVATVIGVVAHVRNGGPRDDGEPQIYLPHRQLTVRTVSYAIRAAGQLAPVIEGIRPAVQSVDPDLPVSRLGTMDVVAARVFARDRFNAILFGLFAAVALVLAVIGLYGVLSCQVAERMREIGIRLALGGRPGHVLRHVLGEGMALTAAGVAIGLATAAFVSRGVESLLFGIAPTDPATYAGIAGLLVLTALAGMWLPAHRATRVDPISVLRD